MFPGAQADRDEADYAVVGAPLDATTSFRPGTRFGPDRCRRFARPFEDYDRRTDRSFSALTVHDAGDIHAWNDVPEYLSYLTGTLRDLVREGTMPLLLGGEHTVSAAGVRATDPDVFVCMDAHLDLRDAYDGNPWSHACVTRRILEGDPAEPGETDTAPVTADRAIVLGARSGSRDEWDRADSADVTVVPPENVSSWTPEFDDESVYLSVDIDAADPSVAPGTGTMEPFGLDAGTMRDVVRAIAPRVVGFDVVEVNDRDDGQAAALGAKLLREFVFSHAAGDDPNQA
jgi:agmatinase